MQRYVLVQKSNNSSNTVRSDVARSDALSCARIAARLPRSV